MAIAIYNLFLVAAAAIALVIFIIFLVVLGVHLWRVFNAKPMLPVTHSSDDDNSEKDVRGPADICFSTQSCVRIWHLTFFAMISLLCVMCVTLDAFPVGLGIFVCLVIWWGVWITSVPFDQSSSIITDPDSGTIARYFKQTLSDVLQRFKQRPALIIGGLLAIFAAAFIVNYALWGSCIDMYSGNFSTRMTRRYMRPGCPGPTPCHVYVTLSDQAPSTSLIINFQTAYQTGSVLQYDTVSHASDGLPYAFSATGQQMYFDEIDEPRYVHWVELTGLTPNTVYYFTVGVTPSISTERAVKTAPGGDTFMFISGGDMDANAYAAETSAVAASFSPAFALIGGDLAYANGWLPCYLKWDLWLRQWETIMVTPQNTTIPMLMAIGNHEVQSFFGGDIRTQVPFFTRYFPQQLGLYNASYYQRSTYHSHPIGNNSVIVVLDSDHVFSPVVQTSFLSNALNASAVNKMAVYHVPMYPSVRVYDDDVSKLLRATWLPIFDQNSLKVSFENHDHSYKRSYRLTNGIITANGTQYMGDGCWGRTPRVTESRWYLQKQLEKRHFMVVNVRANNVTITAVDYVGAAFDTVTLL